MAGQIIRVIEKQSEAHWDYKIPEEAPECLQMIVTLIQGMKASREIVPGAFSLAANAGYVGPSIEIRKLEQ